jgi:hypothetical protein
MYFYSHFSNHISSTHWLASDSFTRENFPPGGVPNPIRRACKQAHHDLRKVFAVLCITHQHNANQLFFRRVDSQVVSVFSSASEPVNFLRCFLPFCSTSFKSHCCIHSVECFNPTPERSGGNLPGGFAPARSRPCDSIV